MIITKEYLYDYNWGKLHAYYWVLLFNHLYEELFASKNIHFTMSELAQKLGVKPPSLYNHFKSKDEIIKLTIFREVDCFFDYEDQVIQDLPVDYIEVWLEKFFKRTLFYFNSQQKAKFWRQFTLLEPFIKEQFSIYRSEREMNIKKKLDVVFDLLSCEFNMTEQTRLEALTLMFIMMQGLVEVRLMSNSVPLTESLLNLSWNAFIKGIKYSSITD